MSIVNEALKKAAKEDAKAPLAEKHRSSFSVRPSPIKALLFRGLPVFFLILLLAVVFTQRNFLLQKLLQLGSIPKILKTDTGARSPQVAQSPQPKVNSPVPALIEKKPESDDEESERRLKSGIQLFQDKKYKEAEQEFLKVVSLQPTNALAHNNLGLALKAQGRLADAEIEYLAALQNNPKYPEAFNNLGLLYEQLARVQEAVQQYRKAIELSPGYPEPHLNYAQVLERAGYSEEARRHYQAFLAADPTATSSLRLRVQQHLDNLP